MWQRVSCWGGGHGVCVRGTAMQGSRKLERGEGQSLFHSNAFKSTQQSPWDSKHSVLGLQHPPWSKHLPLNAILSHTTHPNLSTRAGRRVVLWLSEHELQVSQMQPQGTQVSSPVLTCAVRPWAPEVIPPEFLPCPHFQTQTF